MFEVVLPVGEEIEKGLGFKDAVYVVAEADHEHESERRCEYDGGKCHEMARHFNLQINSLIVDGVEIPLERYEDVKGFLEQNNRELHLCLPHLSDTLLSMKRDPEDGKD